METNCDCKMNLKEGERKAGLAEKQGRNEEEFLFAATFLYPGSVVLPLSLNWGNGQPTNKRPEVGGGHPMSLHLWVVVTVCFQPPVFMVTSTDGPCWGFCFFQPSLLCSCPIMRAKEHSKRSVVTSPHQRVIENRYGRKHCSEL